MTSISTAGSGLQSSPVLLSRMGALARTSPPTLKAEDTPPQASTVLTLAGEDADDVVYNKPKALDTRLNVPIRAWASKPQDAISALMVRNSGTDTAGSLAEQWRGLGGALLSRFATTDSSYRQALVDHAPPQGADGVAAERTDALDTQALSGVESGAATVNLKVQTRSGQTVELKIAVNPGAEDGNGRGIQVELDSSGSLTSSEREALAKLAEGFDKVLEGLGQSDKLQLDLADLMDYDSSALASLDLTVQNPKAEQALSSFSLHLGTDKKTVALKGSAGEIDLNLDKGTPLGPVNAQQRQSAITEHLRKFDAAADRGHADAALVALFKEAFTQLHATSPNESSSQGQALNPALLRQVQPLQSGLEDFQANFRGSSERTNDRGAVHEKGHADYEFSQKTTVKPAGRTGELSITQAQSEKLDAHYMRSRFGGMLDTSVGNYDIYKVRDSSTSMTQIETAKDKLGQATRSTEQHQLKSFEKLVNHRVKEQGSSPLDKSLVERLLT